MDVTSIFSRRTLTAGISAVASAAMLGAGAAAQEASPAADHVGPSEGYQVGIYQGSCEDISGEADYDIGEAITFGVSQDDPDQESEVIGAAEGVSTVPLGVSNNVEVDFGTFNDDTHSIAALEGDSLVACGELAGVVSDDQLAVAMPSMNDGTVVGFALLSAGDGQTEAKVYMFDTASTDESSDGEEASGTPAS